MDMQNHTDWGELLNKDNPPIIKEHELWICDLIECVHELIGNPAF